MCLVSDKIKFCTCVNDPIDDLDNYWVLYRFNKKKDLLLMGMPVMKYYLHKEDYKLNVQTLSARLNESDAFDKLIEFKEKDQLEIVFNNLSENERMTYNFQYKKCKWKLEEDIDDFELANHYDELSFGKFDEMVEYKKNDLSQRIDYILPNLGLQAIFNFQMKLQVLRYENGLPFVFLIDEHHGNLNDCINKNIFIAKEFIANENVVLVGVESKAGGKDWDEETNEYVTNDLKEKFYTEVLLRDFKSSCTKFADELSEEYSHLVFGVESIGMSDKVTSDICYEKQENMSNAILNHPLTRERSKHFIKSLFEIYSKNNLKGNLILNCGRNHNSDIQDLIKSGEIDKIAGLRANYIRINTID